MDTLHLILIWIISISLWIMIYLHLRMDTKNTTIWNKDLKNKLLEDKIKKLELESKNLWTWMIGFRDEADLLLNKLKEVENADKLKLIDKLEKMALQRNSYKFQSTQKQKKISFFKAILTKEQKEIYKNNKETLLWNK